MTKKNVARTPKKPSRAVAERPKTAAKSAPKVGFVVECHRDGADHKVISHVVEQTRSELRAHFVYTGSKKALFEDCPKIVETLFDVERCDRVFVVWDLMPCDEDFREADKPSCEKERGHLWARLRPQDRDNKKTVMLCITHELDNWLLADGAALTAVLSRPTHPIKPISDEKRPEDIPNPKALLKKHFKQHGRGEYEDVLHAAKIIAQVKNLTKLERAPSFKRLRAKLLIP